MSWSKTLGAWLLGALLIGSYVATIPDAKVVGGPDVEKAPLLPSYGDEVVRVVVRRGEQEVRAERGEDRRWKIVFPENVAVPPDLVAAMLENLTESQDADLVSAAPTPADLDQFGFDDPETIMEIVVAGEETPVRVEVGGLNPPRTAVYSRTSLSPAVMLVGLNVRYYNDLLFEAAYRKSAG